jgi:hypothetical protein
MCIRALCLGLFLSGCWPTDAAGFRCSTSSDCDTLSCVRGICGGAGPRLDGGWVRPTATSTGPRIEPTVTSDSLTISTAGVFESRLVRGTLTVATSGVTLRNLRVSADNGVGVVLVPGVTRTVLDHVAIEGRVGIQGSDFAASGLSLRTQVGILGGMNSSIEGSWFSPSESAASVFVELHGGKRTVIAGNACDGTPALCIHAFGIESPLSDALFEENWLTAPLRVVEVGNSVPRNTRMIGNRTDLAALGLIHGTCSVQDNTMGSMAVVDDERRCAAAVLR